MFEGFVLFYFWWEEEHRNFDLFQFTSGFILVLLVGFFFVFEYNFLYERELPEYKREKWE